MTNAETSAKCPISGIISKACVVRPRIIEKSAAAVVRHIDAPAHPAGGVAYTAGDPRGLGCRSKGGHILDIPGYLIHGTNRPAGVGMQVSHGCIRMYPEDIERLFGLFSRGTPVRLVNQPIKITWSDSWLYVQLRPLPKQDEYRRLRREAHPAVLTQFRRQVSQEAQAAGFLLSDAVGLEPALERGLAVNVPLI